MISYIEWVDSYSPYQHGWGHKDNESLHPTAIKEHMTCTTLGFVIAEYEDELIVTSTMGGKDGELIFSPLCIPKVSIKERRDFTNDLTPVL